LITERKTPVSQENTKNDCLLDVFIVVAKDASVLSEWELVKFFAV
jgi:hypothetical protein